MTSKLAQTAACIGFVILLCQASAAPIDDNFVAVEKEVSSRPITDNELFVRDPIPSQQSNIFMNEDIEIPSYDAKAHIDIITQTAMDYADNIAPTMDGFSHYDREVAFFCLVSAVVLVFVFLVLFARLKKELYDNKKFFCSSRHGSRSMTKGISDFATDPFNLAPVYTKITTAAAPLAATEEYNEQDDCVEIIEEDLELIV